MGKKGFSLVELIIAAALTALVLFSVSAVIFNLTRSQVYIGENLIATEFVSSLSKYLNTKEGCAASLINLSLPTSTATPVTINNYMGHGAPTPMSLSSGVMLTNKLKIDSLTIKDKGITPYDTTINGIGYRRNMAQIQIKLSIDLQAGSIPVDRIIEIPVLTRISPASGTIDVCGLEAPTAEICAAMGGTFTAPATCTPVNSCRFMGISFGCWPYTACTGANFPSAQKFTLASEAQAVSPPASACPKGGVPTSTGQSSYSFVSSPCDKYGACTTYPNSAFFYICLLCT